MDYGNQNMQLKRIHVKLTSLKHGFNILKQDFTRIKYSISELFGQSSNGLTCLKEHKELVEDSVADTKTSIKDVQCRLDRIEGLVHPFGGIN